MSMKWAVPADTTRPSRNYTTVNVLDFIPVSLHANIANRTSATDVVTYIQAAIDSIYSGEVYFPAGRYCVSSSIVLSTANFDRAVLLRGDGRLATRIIATTAFAAGTAVIFKGSDAVVIGGGIKDMWVDANFNADYAIWAEAGKGMYLESVYVTNSLVTEGLFGHAVTPRFYESKFFDCQFSNHAAVAADRSDYNIRLVGFATDNEIIRCTCANAKLANIRIEPGGNEILACHVYGFPTTHEADYGYDIRAQTRLIGNVADGFTVAGVCLGPNADETTLIGNRLFWPFTTTADGYEIASGLTQLSIVGTQYGGLPSGKVKLNFVGTQPSDSFIAEDFLHSDGSRLLIGHTASLAALNNARVQVFGDDFNSAHHSIGRWSADNQGPFLTLFKSRNATIGAHTIVNVSDILGAFDFAGSDGVTVRVAARIVGRVGGTPGAGDMPGQIEFLTAADGGTTLTTRLSIDEGGNVAVGDRVNALATTATDGFLHVPVCEGTPTGSPTIVSGSTPIVVDITNNKLYFWSAGAWRDAGP